MTPPSGLRLWGGFGAMCVGMFMAILDIQIVATSLPAIRGALDIPADRMSWIQTAYLIAEVIAIPLTGWLTRLLGMRRLFIAAVSVFTLASIGCAASSGFGQLVAWRVLQGFAGGTLIPAVFSAVFLLFPFATQGRATTIAGLLAVLAPTAGPVAGGWITDTASWHWLFLVNVAPGVLSALAGAALLPREPLERRVAAELDIVSLALMALSLAALEIGLKEAPGRGWTSPVVLGLLVGFVAAGLVFVLRTLRRAKPVVDLSTFRDRDFAIGCALSFVLGMGLYGSVYLMPVFLGLVRGHGAFAIGTIMLATGLAQLVGAPVAVELERRFDPRILTAVGFALFGAGLALSGFDTPQTDGREMVLPQVVRGAAIMLCLLPPTRLALGHLPAERVPDASGLFNLMRNLGGAIGIALVDTLLFGRAEEHGRRLLDRLTAGDLDAARFLGIPEGLVQGRAPGPLDPMAMAYLRPLIEKGGLTLAVDEAWLMLAAVTFAGLAAIPFVTRRGAPVAGTGPAVH
ncbi:DHA2 family efflux MFS transporter permease subunit [Prosthecomicrobium sp. N25]|uniref:DHA2 family efflux MFS transporter permease subunit n=1 Tax=Prosthecomicrobium sp. N25 TaxID=3129254 RepID=UPI0030772292